MECRELKKRYESLKTNRASVEEIWNEIERYIVPFRGKMFERDVSENAVEWSKYRLYDSTAVQAAHTLAASMQGSLVSPATKWFYLTFSDDDLDKDNEAKEWLEECEETMYSKIQESNFNMEMAETLLDLSSFHTAAMVEEYDEQNGQLIFNAIPIKETFFELDHHGRVSFFVRIMEWPIARLVEKFGKDGLPESLKNKADNPSLANDRIEVAFAIYKRPENADSDISKPLAPEARPMGFKYFTLGTQEQIGEEGGYFEMPAFVPRWEKASGSDYGYGPSQIAMPDIKMLNTLVEMITRAAEKVIDPPTMGKSRGVLGDLDMGPGGHTTVRDVNDIKVLESGARFDVSQLQKEGLQQSIRQTFRVDELEMKESPAMTATEVQVRYELMQRLLGPTLGRLQNDLLDPIIQTTFNILFRNGLLPDPPQVVLEAAAEMNVEYLGPLSRAQKMDQVAVVEGWVASIAPLVEVKPEILDIIDFDALARETADMRGVPAVIVRSESQVKKVRQEREEEQARIAAIEEARAEGEAMEAVGKGEQAMGPVQ